jgi:hypothetical protein
VTAREWRLVGGAGLILAVALLVRGVPVVASRIDGWHQRATARVALAARARAELADAERLEEVALTARSRFDSLAPRVVAAGSRAEAQAALGMLVEHRARQHRARLVESRPIPDSVRAGRLARVTLQVVLESDLPGLVGTLRALEAGDPVIELRALRLEVADPGGPSPVEVIVAEATLTGWSADVRGEGR